MNDNQKKTLSGCVGQFEDFDNVRIEAHITDDNSLILQIMPRIDVAFSQEIRLTSPSPVGLRRLSSLFGLLADKLEEQTK